MLVLIITSAFPYEDLISIADLTPKKAFNEFMPFDFEISDTFFEASTPR